MTKVNPHDGISNITYEPLLDPESSLMVFLSEPAISTISFFQGDVDITKSREWLKERLTLICNANPWLAGRLVKNKKIHKNLLLAIPHPVTGDDIDALICTGAGADDALSGISTKTKYEAMCDKILKSKLVVGPGYKLVGKDRRVAKFSLIEVDEGQVALVVSITHAIADGHTYYKIMSMLEPNSDVVSLCSSRKHDFVPLSKEAIGKKEERYLSSFPFALCCLKSIICGSKAKIGARYVDADKVNELKAKVDGEEYISTNDIMTSAFSRATRCDILLMAINLRKRVKEAGEMDAGNYSLVVLHDAESSASPSDVRHSLNGGPPFKRKTEKLPGFFKTINSKVAMITNWAFSDFNADLRLCNADGESNISLELHLPIPYHPKEIAFPIAVIFKPCANKLGVLYGGSQILADRMVEVGAPIGGHMEMFTP